MSATSSPPSVSAVPRSELLPMTLPSVALATLCAVLWGGLAVSVRFTQDVLPPLGTAGIRFGIASVFVYLWARSQGGSLTIRRHQWTPIVVVGLLLFAQIGLFHYALTQTNAAHGSVLIGSNPVFVALLAHFLLRGDRLSPLKVLGLTVAVAGLVAVVAGGRKDAPALVSGGDAASPWGDAVMLVSSFLLATKTVCTKKALARTEVAKLLLWSNLLATVLFLGLSMIVEGPNRYGFSWPALWGLLYQSCAVAGFCFLAWTALLSRHRASELAVFTFAQPVSGFLFAVWLRGDAMTPALAAGGIAVALGIYLVARH